MAHCHAQGSLPSQLDQERVRALRDRIQSDKRQLQKLESKIRKHELLYETRTSHPVAPPPRHGLESTVIRDNPIFNDHVYDAMDAYMHDEPHKSRRNVQSLYRECQRRIQAAESLLEQASAEVCHHHHHMSVMFCFLHTYHTAAKYSEGDCLSERMY